MGVTIIDKSKKFIKANYDALDRALNVMAIDIERISKNVVPFKRGHLKASGKHFRIGYLLYKVYYHKEYARYQEFGTDGSKVVRHYTMAGKKKFYLRDSGREVARKAVQYFKNQIKTIRI